MNKRRRYKAKRRRRWFGGARASHVPLYYQTCSRCGDYIMACTCWEEDEARTLSECLHPSWTDQPLSPDKVTRTCNHCGADLGRSAG